MPRDKKSITRPEESIDGVLLTNLDQPLFEGANVNKRALVTYLDAMSDRIVPVLRNRPLSVIRVTREQPPFMQKHLPDSAPEWIEVFPLWAEASKRMVSYALCNDRRTLLWFANQRAVEFHPMLVEASHLDRVTHLVIDIDPPGDDHFAAAVHSAMLVHQVLGDLGLIGALKTSGAKGVHIVVPITTDVTIDDAAAATRAIAARAEALDPAATTTAFSKADRGGKVFLDATRHGGATVVATYSPRARPGVPVSFPVSWDDLAAVTPRDFTISTVPGLLHGCDPWADALPSPQNVPDELVDEGHRIPVPRVAAMHEGKRRASARRKTRPNATARCCCAPSKPPRSTAPTSAP